MIAVAYGTTGELIKLAPVLRALQDRGASPYVLCTGQQVEQIPALLADFGLPQPDLWLGRGYKSRDLERAAWIPRWVADVTAGFARNYRMLRRMVRAGDTEPVMLVHGDTFTTVLGALMGHALGIPVAHLEAGMRSGNWRHPFPEELDRMAVARLARIHFAPGAYAADNLRRMHAPGEILDTGGNTIRDALELVPPGAPELALPPEPFGLVSLHRFELLGNPAAFRGIVELLREKSRTTPLLFVDHPVTAAAIQAQGLDDLFDERFRRVPRQRYFNFIALLKASSFLVTDSGGSQEECAYLGHPCLVHRTTTEHPEGLDGPVVLSRMDRQVAAEFLADPLIHTGTPPTSGRRPTDLVMACFERRGYLPARPAETELVAAAQARL
ncbi:MAG: UDP-N-acetylglucosamine 2-epimerase [Solirubrobacterales bacterium]|nr:UDP-N-acetylglucosamine 2-epimerase [Solirubrobacterales bacterium]